MRRIFCGGGRVTSSTAVRPHPALYFIAGRQMAQNKRETQWRIQFMLVFFYCGPMKVGKWMARYLPDEMTEICGARNFFPRSTNRNLAPLSFGSINPFSSRTMIKLLDINRRALRARSHRGDLSPKSMKKFGK